MQRNWAKIVQEAQENLSKLNTQLPKEQAESTAANTAASTAAATAAQTAATVANAGYNLKWSQKSAAENAAKASQAAAANAALQSKQATETQAAKRAAEFNVIQTQYDKSVNENPHKYKQSYAGHGFDNSLYNNHNKKAETVKAEAEKNIRYAHLTADGFEFANIGVLSYPAHQALKDEAQGFGRGYRSLDHNSARQVQKVFARNDLLYGKISKGEYHKRVGIADAAYKKEELKQSQQRSAQARAQVAGYLQEDREHWGNVTSNPATYQNKLTGSTKTDITLAPVVKEGYTPPAGNIMQFSRDDKPVSAKEKTQIENIIDRQRAQREINAQQRELFNAIRSAPNASQAMKIRSAALSQNPNVGTYNAIFDNRTGKMKESSGVFGIGDGTVKDLNYNKLNRETGKFPENSKLGNIVNSQGNIIASNLKSSSGSEWNFSSVPTAQKTAKAIPVPPYAAGFLGGLSLFTQSPKTSSKEEPVSYEILSSQYDEKHTAYTTRLDAFNLLPQPTTDAEWTYYEKEHAEITAQGEALESLYTPLNEQYQDNQKDFEEWGGYMKDSEGWLGYVQNDIRPKDMPRDEFGNVNDPVTGALVKTGWNVIASINNLGVFASKTLEPEKYANEKYVDYYSTPVTNAESFGFGAAIGTAQQGAGYWNGFGSNTEGAAGQSYETEKKQIDKNFERNWQEAGLTTVFEGAMYPIAGGARLAQKGITKLVNIFGKNTVKSAVQTPTAPKFTASEIAAAKKQWNLKQQGITNPSQAKQTELLKILKSPEAKKLPKDPTPSELKLYDDVINTKLKNVPSTKVPTVFKNIAKIVDDLPIIRTKNLPVKPKSTLPIKKVKTPDGLPIRFADNLPIKKTPDLIMGKPPKGVRGFVLPFGWPNFSGRSGGGGIGYKGKPQSKRKFTAWDVRTDKIGFYGFGRKSDSYGGVFTELDNIDKVAKSKRKVTKRKAFDDVFEFNFDF